MSSPFSIYQILQDDHYTILDLLEELSESMSGDVQYRVNLYGLLKAELTLHEEAEEITVYPAFRSKGATRTLIEQATEEHYSVNRLLNELDQMGKSDERWSIKLRVLQEHIAYHVEREEKQLLDEAKKTLTDEEAFELGRLFLEKKDELATLPSR